MMNKSSEPGDVPVDDGRPGGTDWGQHIAPWESLSPSKVAADDVRDLIRRADEHALGRPFLLEGAQDAVAATFGVHAFVVDAARAHLHGGDAGA